MTQAAYTELREALTGHAPLTALVAQRIRPDKAQDSDAFPFVVYRRQSFEPLQGLDGTLFGTRHSMQIECWAETRAQSLSVADEAMAALLAADLPVEVSEPDGYDPQLGVLAVTLNVDVWT